MPGRYHFADNPQYLLDPEFPRRRRSFSQPARSRKPTIGFHWTPRARRYAPHWMHPIPASSLSGRVA